MIRLGSELRTWLVCALHCEDVRLLETYSPLPAEQDVFRTKLGKQLGKTVQLQGV